MAILESRNPFNQEVNETFETLSNDELDQVIAKAHEAFERWKTTSFAERKALCLKLADQVDKHREEMANLATKEMGMINKVSENILVGSANLIRWYANHAEEVLGDEEYQHYGLTGKIKYDPLGVIMGIAPWNFPYNQVLRAAVANIIAGNTVIYKHASNVPLCAQMIHSLFEKAGFPEGVYTNIYVESSQTEHILSNEHVAGVNITGSEGAGSAVGSLAGKYLKPSVLELGGNDAFVLIDHKDTDAMAKKAVACRISNGGQRCNASKRFIVLEKHYEAFIQSMKKHMEALTVGDPMQDTTDIPPMARPDLVDTIHAQVQETIEQGAKLVTGGKKLTEGKYADGNFYAPTVLADVTPEMRSYKEEVFGPVASVIKSSSVEESIQLANNSKFGLSAVVFGDNMDECKRVADELEGGMIFINNPAGSKSSLPFGGVKNSGYGKENGPDGLRAFTNKKAIVYSIDG